MTKKNTLKTKTQMILILFLMLMSSTPNTFAQAEDIKNPNKIVIDSPYSTFDDLNLDPATAYDIINTEFIDLSYEGLVMKDPKDSTVIVGLLATNWVLSSDGKTYTFNLRKDAFYHNGMHFNAYTMKYSLDRLMIINDYTGPAYLLQEYIVGAPQLIQTSDINVTQANEYLRAKGISVIDDYTLQIKLVRPFNYFLNVLCLFGKAVSPYSVIVNRPANYSTNQADDNLGMVSLSTMFPDLKDWTKLGLSSNHDPRISGIVPQSGKDSNNKHIWMTENMVGTGPYILDHHEILQIQFNKNTNWFGTFAVNSPDQIIWNYEFYIENLDFNFRTGQTDYLPSIRSFTDYIPSYIDITTGKSIIDGVNAYIQPSPTVLVYGFNKSDYVSSKYVVPSHDIDKTWNETHIIKDHLVRFGNNNSDLASINNPFSSLKFRQAFSMAVDYDSFIAESYYNILATRAEGIVPYGIFGHQDRLIEKGFVPSFNLELSKQLFQEVGWRGNITLCDLGTPKGFRRSFNLLVQSAIAYMDIGININVQILNQTTFAQETKNFPIRDWGWIDDYDDPLNSIYPYYFSKGFFASYFQYNNQEVDLLINQLQIETNSVKRNDLIRQIEEKVCSDTIYIYMVNNADLILTRNWLYNIEESGSLDPYSFMKFQYISKGDPTNITTSDSQSMSSNVSNIPGFELNAILLTFTIFILMNKRKKW